MKKINRIIRGVKNPNRVIHYLFNLTDEKLKITEIARVGGGERLVIKDWISARNSRDFVTLAHIQRYE